MDPAASVSGNARALVVPTAGTRGSPRRSAESTRRARDTVAMAAHDLRAPLAAIELHADLLARRLREGDEPAMAEVRDVVVRVSQISKAARTLVEEILSVAVVEDQSRPVSAVTAVDVEDVIHQALVLERDGLERSRCRVRVERRRAFHGAQGWWHRGSLLRIFSNLFNNAANYAPGALIRLVLSRQSDVVKIVFADTGPGLPAGDPGIDAKAERPTPPSHGLGLGIVRSAVERLGGRVAIRSKPRRGLAFIIELPIAGAPKPERARH